MGQTFKYPPPGQASIWLHLSFYLVTPPLDKLLFGYTSLGQASIWLHLPWTSFYLVTPPLDKLLFGYTSLGQASIWLHLPWTSFYLALVTPPLDKLIIYLLTLRDGHLHHHPPEHISRHLPGQRHHVSKHPPLAMTHTDRGVRSNFPVISTLVFSGTPPSPHQPIREQPLNWHRTAPPSQGRRT